MKRTKSFCASPCRLVPGSSSSTIIGSSDDWYSLKAAKNEKNHWKPAACSSALDVGLADLVDLHEQMTIRISTMTSYCPTVTTDDDIITFLRAFGARLRQERERRHLSQEDFAALIGLDRTFYGALERGDRGCNIARLSTMSRALGVPLDKLLPPG